MTKTNTVLTKFFLLITMCLLPVMLCATSAVQDIVLYTTYTSRAVTPGQTLTYEIEVINRTNSIQKINLSVQSISDNWEPTFKIDANVVEQIAVKPQRENTDNSKTVELELQIPLKIDKGNYHFTIHSESVSGYEYSLPLEVEVTEQGNFETELEVDQPNMEGYADSDFTYNLTLKNQTAVTQNYALTADAPRGWDVRFKTGGDYITSVTAESNSSKSMTVEIKPSQNVEANTYEIDVQATSGNTSGQVTLETVIKGKYDLLLTTPSRRLSTEVTAGGKQVVKLLLKNTGSVPLRDITLSSSTPADWSVKFNNKEVTKLKPGSSTTIKATIAASSKAIAGDYQLQISAETPDASSEVAFRVTVDKPLAWGSVGILIILAVVGGLFYIFKAYGRR